MNGHNGCRPEIIYPCRWQYRLIGSERAAMIEAVGAMVDIGRCAISEGNTSSGGRYCSIIVELTVDDEGERLRYYRQFAADPAVRVVL